MADLRAKVWTLSRRQLDGFDASWVAPRLWVGAYPGDGPDMLARTKAVGIDRVVRCANQETHEFDVGIDSNLNETTAPAFERASDHVADLLRRRMRVLVTCQAGINRSALVAGLALVKAYGYPGSLALREIQANRRNRTHIALCNTDFADYLVQSTKQGKFGPLLRLYSNLTDWTTA